MEGRWGTGAETRGTARHALHERCDTAAWAAIRPRASATTQPGLPMTRPGVSTPGRAGAHLGVLLGQQAVHLVHSACFDPVLTQHCS